MEQRPTQRPTGVISRHPWRTVFPSLFLHSLRLRRTHAILVFVLTFVLISLEMAHPMATSMAASPSTPPAAPITLVDTTLADFSSGERTNVDLVPQGDGGLTIGSSPGFSSHAYLPYHRFGLYVSDIKHIASGFNRLTMGIQAVVPQNSSLEMEGRVSVDGTTWSEWQPLADGARLDLGYTAYFAQYRATFLAMSSGPGPVLDSVTLTLSMEILPAGQGVQPAGTTAVTYKLYATREGLVGGTTANGHVIAPHDHFVALPSRVALASNGGHEYEVLLTYKGRQVQAPVWDVGPWNIHDNYWDEQRDVFQDLQRGIPESQAAFQSGYNSGKDEFGRTVLNPAGIDLADGTFWDDLGMVGSDWVEVTFLWEQAPPAPPSGTVSINNGAATAHRPDVTLYLTYSNATQVRFRNENTSIWSTWYPVSATKAWTLSKGNGPKTVYAQYRNSSATSNVVSDSINLDYTRPTGSLSINGGSVNTSVITVTLGLYAYDPDGIKDMRIGNLAPNGSVEWGPWRAFSSSVNWRLRDGPDGRRTVCVMYRDIWNNRSVRYESAINFRRQPPALVRPVGDLVVNRLDTLFDWTDVPNAKAYKLLIQNTSTGAIIYQCETAGSEYRIPDGVLRPGGAYAWWVKAKTYGDWSGKSEQGTFSVSPMQPSLLSPADQAITTTTPLLDWADVTGADKYRVEIKNANTGLVVLDVRVVASQYQVPTAVLKRDHYYKWRVTTKAGPFFGTPSEWRRFSTGYVP